MFAQKSIAAREMDQVRCLASARESGEISIDFSTVELSESRSHFERLSTKSYRLIQVLNDCVVLESGLKRISTNGLLSNTNAATDVESQHSFQSYQYAIQLNLTGHQRLVF